MRATNRRRGSALVAALVMATSGVEVVAVPAQAGGISPVWVVQASTHDSSPHKAATATCPANHPVFAAGARIVDPDGGVVLTGMIPDPALTSVTATGSARTGYSGEWSLVAFAVCDLTTSPPGRVAATALGWPAACRARRSPPPTGRAARRPAAVCRRPGGPAPASWRSPPAPAPRCPARTVHTRR